jgi:glycogen synthase
VFNAATGMAKRGHEVRVLCASKRRTRSLIDGVVFHEFPLKGSLPESNSPYKRNLEIVRENADTHLAEVYQYWFEYVNMLKEAFEPEIIDCQEYRAPGYLYVHHRLLGYGEAVAPIITLCRSSSKIRNAYDDQPSFSWDNFFVGERECYQLAGSDGIAAASDYISNLIHARYHISKPQVCYDNSPHAGPESLLPPCDNDELVSFGGLSGIRGIRQLLKVCSYLWEEGLTFRLKVVEVTGGYVPGNKQVINHIREIYGEYLGSGHLQILPDTDSADKMKEVLAHSRAVVNSSPMEPSGDSFIEAMCHGRPVIAAAHSWHTDTVEHGKSGFIYNNLDELESCIKLVLSASRPELEEWGIQANRRACEKFSSDTALPRREGFYEQIVQHTRKERRSFFPNCSCLDKAKFTHLPQPRVAEGKQEYETGLLSVVVTCYNLGQFLEQAVVSVYESTYRPMELTVVDDGSKDPRTIAVLGRLGSTYQNADGFSFRVVKEERNRGPAEARNLGAAISRGEFISFVDADDKVEGTYFQKAISVLNQYGNVGFVGGWAESFAEETGNWIIVNFDFPLALVRNQGLMASVIRHGAYEKQTLSPIGEDYEGYIAIVAKGWVGVNLPEVVLHYRVRSNSLYHATNNDVLKRSHQHLVENHPDLFRAYGDELYLIFCHNYLFELENSPPVEYEKWLRQVVSKPSHIVKFPYFVGKLLLPMGLKIKIRNMLGIPRGRSFISHLMEIINRRRYPR